MACLSVTPQKTMTTARLDSIFFLGHKPYMLMTSPLRHQNHISIITSALHHHYITIMNLHPPVEVDVAGHRLPCVLRLVVAQLLVFCENKEPLPPHTTLLDQPAWTRGDRWMEGLVGGETRGGGRRVRRTKNGERRMEEMSQFNNNTELLQLENESMMV